MRVAVVEPNTSGHHQTYAAGYAKTLLELGMSVDLFTPHRPSAGMFENSEASSHHRFSFQDRQRDSLPSFANKFFLSKDYLATVSRAVQHKGFDRIVFPTMYSFQLTALRFWDGFFKMQWSATFFDARPFYPEFISKSRVDSLVSPIRAFTGRHIRSLGILDSSLASKFQKKGVRCPIITFPDITDETPADPEDPLSLQIQKRAQGRTIVALLGHMRERKGVGHFLKIASLLDPSQYYFVLAGQVDLNSFRAEEKVLVSQALVSNQENLFVHNGAIPDGVLFNSIINACDILYLCYENFPNSSNMLTKAAIFQKPVLTSKGYTMEHRTSEYSLGLSVNYGNIKESEDSLVQLSAPNWKSEAKPKWEAYHQLHSYTALKSALSSMLQ